MCKHSHIKWQHVVWSVTSNGQPWTVCSSTFHTAHPCSLRSAFNHSPMWPRLGRNAKHRSIIPERGQANWWVVTTRGDVFVLSYRWNLGIIFQPSDLRWCENKWDLIIFLFILYFLIILWYSLVYTLNVAAVGLDHTLFKTIHIFTLKIQCFPFFHTFSYFITN